MKLKGNSKQVQDEREIKKKKDLNGLNRKRKMQPIKISGKN